MTADKITVEGQLATLKMLRAGEEPAAVAAIVGVAERTVRSFGRVYGWPNMWGLDRAIDSEKKFLSGQHSFRASEDARMFCRTDYLPGETATETAAKDAAGKLREARKRMDDAYLAIRSRGDELDLTAEAVALNAADEARVARSALKDALAAVDAERHARAIREAVEARATARSA